MTSETAKDWLTLDEAAQQMGSTRLNILMHIKRGLLPAEEHGGEWRISLADWQVYLASAERKANTEVCAKKSCRAHGCGSCS